MGQALRALSRGPRPERCVAPAQRDGDAAHRESVSVADVSSRGSRGGRRALDRHHVPPRLDRAARGAHDRPGVTRPLSPEEMYPAGHRSIASRILSLRSGLRVRLLESGPADGPTALLLHGWGACSYSFRHALELLPNHGIRTIAADLRGFGLSDKPSRRGEYTLDAYILDLEQLLDTIGVSRP